MMNTLSKITPQAGDVIHYIAHNSPVGTLLIAATDAGISGIYFETHRHFKGKDGWVLAPEHSHLKRAAQQLDEYFTGDRQQFDLPLALNGTPFQRAVWDALIAIPFGQSTTYGAHAAQIGRANAVRAVGTAIGRNPVSIIVPCHRVVGASGSLTGYAGGLERKGFLLRLESYQDQL
ncbi:methylated-DNA--[protein]-cysteine S-methyltransferase [Glaciimonas sp. PAMC28666]|uniref:methylated-DNA--[protein]-cysteine S-methyltransferase n=1 Tax=Glaciimonas sp. PAMC28666 TaxID=2807626 RepID=UPI00351C9DF6